MEEKMEKNEDTKREVVGADFLLEVVLTGK